MALFAVFVAAPLVVVAALWAMAAIGTLWALVFALAAPDITDRPGVGRRRRRNGRTPPSTAAVGRSRLDLMALAHPLFKTVVVGVDGRDGGRDALRLAEQLTEAGGGDLVAVRIFAYHHRPHVAGAPAVEQEGGAARAALEHELSAMGVGRIRTEAVGDTSPARALHRIAERERADLLVVGSTHRGAVGRVLAGDVTLGSLHGSPCPVAVAPSGFAARDSAPLARIGVGFDGASESRQALALAAALAATGGARLELVCAVPPLLPLFAEAPYPEGGFGEYRLEGEELVGRTLDGLDVDAVGEAVVGNALESLVTLSQRVDLVVVGSRGWGPVRRILLGSTSARLVREAACPVLVVPRGAATGQPGEREPAGADTAPRAVA
jgi:nucleotide-binding universal stress UspA family protein